MSVRLLAIFLMFMPVAAYAQSVGNPDSKEPLEITADESLEWHRNELYFRAKKNVKAKQGDTTLLSQVLTAEYREGAQGGMQIHTILAEGAVEILSADSKAYGDSATYDIDEGYAVMRGNDLRLVSQDQTVTANDKFEYWVAQGKLEAVGRAVAVREGDKLEADRLIASFVENKAGQRKLKTLEALGNVVITTPDEVLRGNRGLYKADTSIAELYDNVKITRGPNVLTGTKADVNLKTNVSRILGGGVTTSGTGSGRVRAVFYPGSEKKPEIEEGE